MMQRLFRIQFAAGVMVLAAAASASAQSGAPDPRRVIELPALEREHVMHEMQQFLVTIRGVMEASARDDFKAAVAAARASGRSEPTGIEKSIAPKLPPEFRKLAFDTHARFDQLAVASEQGDRARIFEIVTALLGNCVACHAGYVIRAK